MTRDQRSPRRHRACLDPLDEVVVAVLYPAKTGTFPVARRIELIQASQTSGAGRVVRGSAARRCLPGPAPGRSSRGCAAAPTSRSSSMALMNRHLTGVETVFLPGNPAYEHVSSSLIKEVHALGGDITGLVPDVVCRRLRRRCRSAISVVRRRSGNLVLRSTSVRGVDRTSTSRKSCLASILARPSCSTRGSLSPAGVDAGVHPPGGP
jgi:pantetheine-phosphate adenylyltransferase